MQSRNNNEIEELIKAFRAEHDLSVNLYEQRLALQLELQRRKHAQEITALHQHYGQQITALHQHYNQALTAQYKAFQQELSAHTQQTEAKKMWHDNAEIQTQTAINNDMSLGTGSYSYSPLQTHSLWNDGQVATFPLYSEDLLDQEAVDEYVRQLRSI